MPEIEVKSISPDIDYEIEKIVMAMLKSGTKTLTTNKKLRVTLKDGQIKITEPVEAEISIKIQASDTLLERAKAK